MCVIWNCIRTDTTNIIYSILFSFSSIFFSCFRLQFFLLFICVQANDLFYINLISHFTIQISYGLIGMFCTRVFFNKKKIRTLFGHKDDKTFSKKLKSECRTSKQNLYNVTRLFCKSILMLTMKKKIPWLFFFYIYNKIQEMYTVLKKATLNEFKLTVQTDFHIAQQFNWFDSRKNVRSELL